MSQKCHTFKFVIIAINKSLYLVYNRINCPFNFSCRNMVYFSCQSISYYYKILKWIKVNLKIIITSCASINFIDYIPLAISWNHVNEDTAKSLLFLGKMKDYFIKPKKAWCWNYHLFLYLYLILFEGANYDFREVISRYIM